MKIVIEFLGFALIFYSIELFGNTELFTWQMLAQCLMVTVGVLIVNHAGELKQLLK